MAYTVDDFKQKIADTVGQFPTISALYQAGDPRVIQPQYAMAAMLAMMSQQIELAAMEPFDKVRDSTVLADASIKGIIPLAVPARVRVTVENPTNTQFVLGSGRTLLDSNGRSYAVDLPVTVLPNDSVTCEALQRQLRTFTHTVTTSEPFYKIEITAPEDGRYISGITVQGPDLAYWLYKPEYTGVAAGEKMYHIESDEYRRLFVVLGYQDVVGYQPAVGEVLTITVSETTGDARPAVDSPFALEYTYTPQDAEIKLSMESLLVPGSDPISLATLRELCKYPSIYDKSAVFLGEFDKLVRQNLPGLKFLSIWNETLEEQVRGPSVDNINRLFVSYVPPDGGNQLAIQNEIIRIISEADDSYDVAFVAPEIVPIGVTVSAAVSRIQDTTAVAEQIKEALLDEYGAESAAAQVGMLSPQYKRVYDLLRAKVPALQDNGSDFSVSISVPTTTQLPEHYRYMTDSSVIVTVALANYNLGQFGR